LKYSEEIYEIAFWQKSAEQGRGSLQVTGALRNKFFSVWPRKLRFLAKLLQSPKRAENLVYLICRASSPVVRGSDGWFTPPPEPVGHTVSLEAGYHVQTYGIPCNPAHPKGA